MQADIGRSVRRNLLRGSCKNDFLLISRDNRGKNLFLQINILSAISGDLFDTVISVMARNDF